MGNKLVIREGRTKQTHIQENNDIQNCDSRKKEYNDSILEMKYNNKNNDVHGSMEDKWTV
jgi:hypothetical protein